MSNEWLQLPRSRPLLEPIADANSAPEILDLVDLCQPEWIRTITGDFEDHICANVQGPCARVPVEKVCELSGALGRWQGPCWPSTDLIRH